MSFFLPIYRKEFRRYFATPIGPVLLAGSALLCVAMAGVAGDDALRQRVLAPLANLTGFLPSQELARQPVALVVAMARVLAMVLVPMITMRLFPEEKQARTMEMLLTSPAKESDIVLGKWMGALSLYLLMVGVSAVELMIASESWRPDWTAVAATYTALAASGAALLIVGEALSTLTRHQSAAAAMMLVICAFAMRLLGRGASAVLGWLVTMRSVRALREAY